MTKTLKRKNSLEEAMFKLLYTELRSCSTLIGRCGCFGACSRILHIYVVIIDSKRNNIINMKVFESEGGENALNLLPLAILLISGL